MKAKTIVAGMLLLAAPAFAATPEGKPPADMSGGHDHAAMMQGMGKPSWTLYPTLKVRMSGESRENMVTTIVPQNFVPGGVMAFSNNLDDPQGRRLLQQGMGGATLDKPANGGFHWLSAHENRDDREVVASTVHSFGERGAKDPTAMFMQQKHDLEIIPQPFPREHSRYRADEDWKFLVRFNGAPLSGQKVWLETSNGSMAEFVSDAQGVFIMHVPDDFKAEEEKAAAHNHGRRGAEFVLATEHVDSGKSWLTAFNGSYGPNAFDQRSLAMGLGFTLLGMLGAVPLLRKPKTGKKGEEAGNA
ncbi:MAG TPA: hypothetical protein VK149_11160 [Sideroxyarcus sp.]|nr:hypothetical protein [Sideroxyarcus sp.]